MSNPISLIVGLANPGKEYAPTRHNAGAWFIESLAEKANVTLRFETKFHGLHATVQLHDKICHLLIPTTFMNHSGQAVRACMAYNKIEPNAVLVAHDDIDLPAGTVKLKFDGGDGGHNGLKDIIRHLHSKQFHRLRIGVSRPPINAPTVDYVLNPPSKADREKIFAAIAAADDVLPLIIDGQIQQAMQALHSTK